ncbi:AraC family transcriptional regulator [Pedobacter africanus]|uniref:AraC family transcriptional regulator n=1 Tax=Pedobacter africanus TaxID=151894 RepID=A0ACC6KVM1_9SPHI|nr:AraC family transcriptional regulator [Pedobacter africanus]MDR6783415.1 AraC family transcriptional regulator [Pedobacter africanus]
MAGLENEIKADYIGRVNKALQFIDERLDTALSLEVVSNVAFFSPFHFHRIFKAITNETLNSYVNRRRLEKAAAVLMHKPEISISELSLMYGFTSNSSFTRAFKNFYGLSPSEFRRQNPGNFSKIGKEESKNGQEMPIFEKYICNINQLKNWLQMNAKIEIKEMGDMNLAYVTSIGHEGIANAYNVLIKWAKLQGLLDIPGTKMVTIYHDSFKITAPEKVRISACISLNDPLITTKQIGSCTIEKGKFIVGSFFIPLSDFEKSWNGLFIWMNENGYKKAERNPFEIYHSDYRVHPEKRCLVDFYIPIL